MSRVTFQSLILKLQNFWAERGCVIEKPLDLEVGAGTMHPATFLRVLGPEPWSVAYVQPSRRPADGRYGDNPFRLGKHYQFQVILKPSPLDVQELYLDSLRAIGLDLTRHDIRFEEDNWESPTLGAWGVGWQVMLDGMEITQFTYFQQAGGIDLAPISAEITYGLERLTMFLAREASVYDIEWTAGVRLRRGAQAGGVRVLEVLLRDRRRRPALEAPRRLRGRGAALPRREARAARLRVDAQVLARLQHARRARRGLGDRARRRDQARARPGRALRASSISRRGRSSASRCCKASNG